MRIKPVAFVLIVLLSSLLIGCSKEPEPQVTQGIYGHVQLKTGRFPTTKEVPVSTVVFVREPVSGEDMIGPFLNNKRSLVKKVTADDGGFYEIELEPGKYSLFVQDRFELPLHQKDFIQKLDEISRLSLEYCGKSLSSEGKVSYCQFEVKKDQLVELDVIIDHTVD